MKTVTIERKAQGLPHVASTPVIDTPRRKLTVVHQGSTKVFTLNSRAYQPLTELWVLSVNYDKDDSVYEWCIYQGFVHWADFKTDPTECIDKVAGYGDAFLGERAKSFMKDLGFTIAGYYRD